MHKSAHGQLGLGQAQENKGRRSPEYRVCEALCQALFAKLLIMTGMEVIRLLYMYGIDCKVYVYMSLSSRLGPVNIITGSYCFLLSTIIPHCLSFIRRLSSRNSQTDPIIFQSLFAKARACDLLCDYNGCLPITPYASLYHVVCLLPCPQPYHDIALVSKTQGVSKLHIFSGLSVLVCQ